MIPYRDDNPTRSFPLITILFIMANVLVFLYQQSLPSGGFREMGLQEAFLYRYAAIPGHILEGKNFGFPMLEPAWLTLFTAMFMHGSWSHLIGNMLYLWIFGNNVEDIMGKFRFIVFYVVCGLAAAGLQIFMSMEPPASRLPMVGASGAIAGVLGGYIVKFPNARIKNLVVIFFPFIRIWVLPAGLVLGIWFLLQFFNAMASAGGTARGGVAFFAHVGGFVAGLLLISFFTLGKPRRWLKQENPNYEERLM